MPISALCTVLVFDESNRLLCPRTGGPLGSTHQVEAPDADQAEAQARAGVARWLPEGINPVVLGELRVDASETGPLIEMTPNRVLFAALEEPGPTPEGFEAVSIEKLSRLSREQPERLSASLARLLPFIREHSIRIPYLSHTENQYIYRFRTDRERNRDIYRSDPRGQALYQSRLCEAIKALKRRKERTAAAPAVLDFGPVRYVIPSHFGFCLGVQNAIERAYETIAGNPGRRVFMLSELIHNPFVNDDLIERGLQYLQSDKGRHLTNPATGRTWWEELTSEDIVIIPAFGATDTDKRHLIEKGLPLNRFDATCMLVEKVWKAARRHALDGYTVLIHGKAEHEETKATFSNGAKYGPSLVVRDLKELKLLGRVILETDSEERTRLFNEVFENRTSPGFDPNRDLERVAVVNQTTLLRNETLALIDHLESVFTQKYGAEQLPHHLSPGSRGDTLCYATQVNQDALQQAITSEGIDHALVIGGKNSSNTYQLYRLCKDRFGDAALYLQSERNILGADRAQHYVFVSDPTDPRQGRHEVRAFLPSNFREIDVRRPRTILVTGGASCPDGIIQQVVSRINALYPPESLRPVEQVLADLAAEA